MTRSRTCLCEALALGVLSLWVAFLAPSAQAAYPGANGRIAFVTGGEIWTVNSDGSAPQQITSPTPPIADSAPSWSPDGTRIAFARGTTSAKDLYVVNANGTGESLLTTSGRNPTWSPDGSEIAFLNQSDEALYRINADGTNRHYEGDATSITDCCPSDPAWSPDGDPFVFAGVFQDIVCDPFDPVDCDGVSNKFLAVRTPGSSCGECYQYLSVPGSHPDWSPSGLDLAYTTARIRVDYYTWSGTDGEIAAVNADGTSNGRTIVAGPETDEQPAWSPDGTKVVFRRSTGTATGLWVVDADGTGPHRILDVGREPDWQPVQVGYPRPISASPAFVSLVPAFTQCTSANRTHGPPLAFPSCNPPQAASPNIAVSQGESRLRSVGSMRFKALVGVPGGLDDADLRMRLSITNVMNRSDFSDYTGILQPEVTVRLTDRDGFQRQTVEDFPIGFQVPCAATSSTTEGASCVLATTMDALAPGAVKEGTRGVWALDQVKVYDGGPAGDGDSPSLFAVQGIFVP